jgi:GNAT superfamily N-acetyltransferase
VAVAGFRTGDSLAWGRYLYVDDLSTAPEARRQGHAGALLDWLIREARKLGCSQLHLDSGAARERFDAHRLCYNHGLAIHSHHFARGVEPDLLASGAPHTVPAWLTLRRHHRGR